MSRQDDKRQLRELKRLIKRGGNKHRRHEFKRQLREDPETAHEAEEDFGGRESRDLNGLDRPVDGTCGPTQKSTNVSLSLIV